MSEKSKSSDRGDISILCGGNASFLDELYKQYLDDPDSVDLSWQSAFGQFKDTGELPPAKPASYYAKKTGVYTNGSATPDALSKQIGVLKLIEAYRNRGHLIADLDPLNLTVKPNVADLQLAYNNLSENDLDTAFQTGDFAAGSQMTLRQLISIMDEVYCGSLGIEYMHISDADELQWLQERIETLSGRNKEASDIRKNILQRLTMAEGLERYLHTKYVGQKRFSLEGGDSLIPLLNDLIQRSGELGAKEIVIGMAHRGRLNVLVNILGKAPATLFEEFEGKHVREDSAMGDVKYHMGFSSDIMTPGGAVHVALSFNPSHLEIINPVVIGSVRARQDRRLDIEQTQNIPILIHGDAAFAGQGVNMETLNMAQTRGYRTGGTVHIVVNNQIGFTTSNPLDSRSTLYCTEVAKMVQSPILHVNADDPDAVIFASRLALEFRMRFKRDVVIDMICYRRHGHNEADEPMVTQPTMYKAIRKHPTTRQIYSEKLETDGIINQGEAQQMTTAFRDALDEGRVVAGQIIDPNKAVHMVDWSSYIGKKWTAPGYTAVAEETIARVNKQLQSLPDGFTLHPRVNKIMQDRNDMANGKLPMDWGFAEIMAYATLVDEGHSVRLSGQDCGRGTFFHRHAVLHNQNDRTTYTPIENITDRPGAFTVINSLLSEEAVLAFEYGYSTTEPRTLVIWEAQFGDFANGAQVVIDQFISSGETKWQRLNGLVMLLPHGYEGQGPEHSSARLERYMQLCAHDNMQVCVPSTPAQIFHLLRRQIIRNFRHPLIVMSPKSLLRHKAAVSSISELEEGKFQNVIDDPKASENADAIKSIILCAGKVYYDLLEKRNSEKRDDVALVRIEQLYPFPYDDVQEIMDKYPAKDIVWCQEEPQNQGCWRQLRDRINKCLTTPDRVLRYAGRDPSASPAVGFYGTHIIQQAALVEQALNG